MVTLISHFYNEEFLLPFWLKHHLPMFDHGIMIDYQSTDRSVDIIKDLAPNWEIRPSRNKDFHYLEIDREVMEIEESINGWKMALNTTEFLVHPDFRSYLQRREQRGIVGVRTTGLVMVERPCDRNTPLTNELLVKQRRFGYLEPDHKRKKRSRLVHRAPNGNYRAGRHSTNLPDIQIATDLFLAWFSWCPMDQVKKRKLQIRHRIPPEHFTLGYGVEHDIDAAALESNYLKETELITDLWTRLPLYKQYIEAL